MDVEDHPRLVHDRGRQADPGVDRVEDALRRDQRRHEPGAVAEHQLDPLVVEVDPVLDRADPGPDRVLDPVRALGVGHDEHPGGGRLLDERVELGRPEVGVARVVPRRQDAAGRRDLDHVRAHPVQLADLPADLVRRRRRCRTGGRDG